MKKKISDLSAQIAALLTPFLQEHVPPQLDLEVTFDRPEQRSIRDDADAGYFKPSEGHSISVRFVPRKAALPFALRRPTSSLSASPETPDQNLPVAGPQRGGQPPHREQFVHAPLGQAQDPVPELPVTRLLRTLAKLEAEPHRQFVALKWFRDVALPKNGFNPSEAKQILTQAISAGLVKTSPIENPHSPYPTTTVSTNRSDPRTREILANGQNPAQRPLPPKDLGFSLSEFVIRERR